MRNFSATATFTVFFHSINCGEYKSDAPSSDLTAERITTYFAKCFQEGTMPVRKELCNAYLAVAKGLTNPDDYEAKYLTPSEGRALAEATLFLAEATMAWDEDRMVEMVYQYVNLNTGTSLALVYYGC